MADETKPAAETKTEAKAPKARTVAKGDTVHVVCHRQAPGDRFGKHHVEATVEKVYPGGQYIDLAVEHDDPAKVLYITRAPREDAGQTCDTWHLPETEPAETK